MPVRRSIDDVARWLFAPLLARGVGDAQVLAVEGEQGLAVTLLRGATVLLVELEPADPTRGCFARTERFNICARRAFEAVPELGPEDRRVVERVVACVRVRERRLPAFERPTTTARSAVREILVDRVLVPEGRGHYYVNPYVGCPIGCTFCYVAARADLSRALEGLPHLAWGRYVDVKVNAAEVLRTEVRQHPPGPVRLSPLLTDPYQPLESRYRVTRDCLEVLLGAGFAPVVLTRAVRVLDDLALLSRFPRAAVGFSIPTDDDAVRRVFEPGADPVERRLAALATLHAAGVRTFAVIQPALPMDVEHLVAAVAPHVQAVRIDGLVPTPELRRLCEETGLAHVADPAFGEALSARLREAFRARGVPVDELDDMASLLG